MEYEDLTGLTHEEAARRLAAEGGNTIAKPQKRSLVSIILGTLKEPMFLFILAAAILYLSIGNLNEGLFMLGAACVSIGLVVFQDARGERALAALRNMAVPRCQVKRDGMWSEIPSEQVVVGDLIITTEGQRIAADACLINGPPIRVDESILTGESAPVTKLISKALTPDSANLFAGTLALDSLGVARVIATGQATRFGSIGTSLKGGEELTPLQRSMRQVTLLFAVAAGVVCVCVVLVFGLARDEWVKGGLSGLTVAIGLVPEEFPMVLAIFTAMGSWRLAQHRVLVRRATAVETLGAISLLVVDKTGTLTENSMQVARIWSPNEIGPNYALEGGLLATPETSIDPMDSAILKEAKARGLDQITKGLRISSYTPLTAQFLAVTQDWEDKESQHSIAAKGAPEAIFKLCALDRVAQDEAEAMLSAMATSGLRVLGVARSRSQTKSFEFVGLIGFMDPLRSNVPDALNIARQAGIGVAMITGDNPETARAIALQAGFPADCSVLLGTEIEAAGPEHLQHLVQSCSIFARVSPDQKLKLLNAFRSLGHITAMTGDGVNDAAALMRAHIGIAMGKHGTDVAREAADIVLLDDSFASIVGGIQLGRRIYTNIQLALVYVVTIHVPIAGLALLPLILGYPPLLLPMHIVTLEFLIDPIASVFLEAAPSKGDAMTKPPLKITKPLLGFGELIMAFLQGGLLLAVCLALYLVAQQQGQSVEQARGSAFACLVVGNVALALRDIVSRPFEMKSSRLMLAGIIIAATIFLLAAIWFISDIAALFQMAAPPVEWITWILGFAILPAVLGSAVKAMQVQIKS
jgi:Ca2+-transporting ATPase